MDSLNFSDKRYLEILKAQEGSYGNGDRCELTSADAFMLLIKGEKLNDLDNLCTQLQQYFKSKNISMDISIEECYLILQGEDVGTIQVDERLKSDILQQAYIVADNGKYMGNNMNAEGKINTSSWLSHSLYIARFAEVTAQELREKQNIQLNVDRIKAAALLHDYGRKFEHKMGHVTKGAESLIDQGYPNAAVATVIHSFFGGKRCANNEPAVPGFYIDENGQECWEQDAPKDDIRDYLETHKLTMGDLLLNLGDLVATDKGVVKLFDRLADIKTRRKIDPTNREYFLLQVITGMKYMLEQVGEKIPNELVESMPKVGDGPEQAEKKIRELSEYMYSHYIKARSEQEQAKKAKIH